MHSPVRWKWVAIAVGGTLGVLLLFLLSVMPLSSEPLRQKIVQTLSAELESDVQLESLQLHLVPLHIQGAGLTLRHHGRRDVPPLITVKAFSVDLRLFDVLRRHITNVSLDGLDIQIPPDRGQGDDEDREPEGVPEKPTPTTGQKSGQESIARSAVSSAVIDRLFAKQGRLVILSDDGQSKTWAIHRLQMQSVGADRAMPFSATLTNAVPPGDIETSGSFGPWRSDAPGRTPLDGRFDFARADLNYFKGIGGTLAARGSFGGWLSRIDVHGETDTPQFTLSIANHPMPLHATYHAIIDATNGNTTLERIDAKMLDTSIRARGSVAGEPHVEGRTVKLDVVIDEGRLEDVLRLAVDTPKPPMTGALKMTTAFLLPPGDDDVIKRLRLDGRFEMAHVTFTSATVQQKIDELSRRSRGHAEASSGPVVGSDFKGRFSLAHGTLRLPSLAFDVPGAAVRLAGTYALVPGTLDFTGTLAMHAKVSEATTGWKHYLLKVFDPLFSRKGGGSVVPIKISGSRENPSFGLDKSRIFGKK